MPSRPLTDALDAADVTWAPDVPLAKRTYWRVGGPADVLAEVDTVAQLAAVQLAAAEAGIAVTVLGNGSNVLVHDDGIRGLVIRLGGALADTAVVDGLLVAGAGLRLTVLLARAARHGWPGLEPLAGIPGTVGGAVWMNAGTSLGEIGDRIAWVEVVQTDGAVVRLDADACGFAYRHSAFPPGAIVARAALRLDGDVPESLAAMRTFLDRRKATQPLDKPSCGSTFTNPPGDHAGRLIDAAGLKGFAIGGAQVSEKHANFVLNLGDATADDIAQVIRHARTTVRDRFGVWLTPEVQLLGPWASDALG